MTRELITLYDKTQSTFSTQLTLVSYWWYKTDTVYISPVPLSWKCWNLFQ